MEWRIKDLESDIRRLRAEVEALKTDLERRREAMVNRTYLAAYLVTTAVLLGALWRGFGWI
jgi:hypothetical protein